MRPVLGSNIRNTHTKREASSARRCLPLAFLSPFRRPIALYGAFAGAGERLSPRGSERDLSIKGRATYTRREKCMYPSKNGVAKVLNRQPFCHFRKRVTRSDTKRRCRLNTICSRFGKREKISYLCIRKRADAARRLSSFCYADSQYVTRKQKATLCRREVTPSLRDVHLRARKCLSAAASPKSGLRESFPRLVRVLKKHKSFPPPQASPVRRPAERRFALT